MKKPTPRKLSNLPKVTLVVAEPGLEDPAPEFVLLYFHVCFLRGDLPHHRPPHPTPPHPTPPMVLILLGTEANKAFQDPKVQCPVLTPLHIIII